MSTEKYGGTTLPPFANATDHPVAVEDTTTIQQEISDPALLFNQEPKPYIDMNQESIKQEQNRAAELTGTISGPDRVLTFGEKAVGITFNPGKNETVEKIKRHYADVIDTLNDLRAQSESPEAKRMLSIAITESQSAQMWAVKAVTWQY